MKILKNRFCRTAWNKWQGRDKEETIRKEIEKLAPSVALYGMVPQNYRSPSAINDPFSINELHRTIKMIKKISAPGRDRIDYDMIKHLPLETHQCLLEIFNKIWLRANIPFLLETLSGFLYRNLEERKDSYRVHLTWVNYLRGW